MSDIADRIHRVRQQIRAFRELHSQELQMILDELTDIAASVEVAQPEAQTDAASSPKRAKWLAEQEARARLSRRELFRGRGDDQQA